MGISIIGMGKYLPERILTNEDLTKMVDTSDEWITSRTGIRERRVATGETTWQMGAAAAKAAVEDAGVDPAEIDLVVASTVTGDYLTPSLACLVANALGLKSPGCIDVNCACAGFVNAVDLAGHYLNAGDSRTALVVSSEMLTKITNYEDRTTCVLFGDGAGAAVLRKSDGLYACAMGSDPAGGSGVFARGVAPQNPFWTDFDPLSDGWDPSAGHTLRQNGKEVYKFATRSMPLAVRQACEKAGVQLDELKWIFSHQANYRILETAAKNLGFPMERFYLNIADHGNISSACIPVCLAEAKAKGLLERGDKLCIVGFGGGLVYAAAVFEY